VVEQKWIKEIDINPLLASGDTLLALDARVVLFPPKTQPESLPRPAIRPYPTRYISSAETEDGTPITIRPIRPEDEVMMRAFHAELSAESVFSRYMHAMSLAGRIAHDRLSRVCFIDYDREMRLVAEIANPDSAEHAIIGVATAMQTREHGVVEMALSVVDRYQSQGVGTILLEKLIQYARRENLHTMIAGMFPENHRMIRLAEAMGFEVHTDLEEGLVMGTLVLQ
jgi:acetyltransferase